QCVGRKHQPILRLPASYGTSEGLCGRREIAPGCMADLDFPQGEVRTDRALKQANGQHQQVVSEVWRVFERLARIDHQAHEVRATSEVDPKGVEWEGAELGDLPEALVEPGV